MFLPSQAHYDWLFVSTFAFELFVAVVMLVIVIVLLLRRSPELRQCWKVHRRVRSYICLSGIAIVADFAMGVAGILWLVYDDEPGIGPSARCLRQLHIALDTLVLYGTLGVASKRTLPASSISVEDDTIGDGHHGLENGVTVANGAGHARRSRVQISTPRESASSA